MLVPTKMPPLLPPKGTALKLFIAGSTLGPLVDSLHNQCLLTYDFLPITVDLPYSSSEHAFASSWAVPPLLGFAYIVLGYVLPRIVGLIAVNSGIHVNENRNVDWSTTMPELEKKLAMRAILAVSSTAAIIKLSEFLETHSGVTYQFGYHPVLLDAKTNLIFMALADALQWLALDRTLVALIVAVISAIGGPLSELPFVAHGFWHYNVDAADYLPLSGTFQTGGVADTIASSLLGEKYQELSLSSITGPCYFAVTLDAVALGRYIYQTGEGKDDVK
jgi:hypothetical protein